MKICFLVPSIFDMRGDVRATVNLATALSARHEVEILSVRRTREQPFFPLKSKVGVRWLIDSRPGRRYLLPRGEMRAEVELWRALRGLRCDVLITTRPSLAVQAARHAPRDAVRVAREWSRPATPAPIKRHYPRLSAVVASTETTRDEWLRTLGEQPPVHLIPDALPVGPLPRSRLDNRIVSAGGRWVPAKAFDRLIRAFAIVADKRPDWRLRLYGGGSEDKRLRNLAGQLGLHNHVFFMGTTPDLPGEFAKASIVAVTSRAETPGMTVIEALGCGVPVMGFDSPRGPGEFVTSGRDGVLVPEGEGEIEAYASALLALIDDERRRQALAAGALETASAYAAPAVAARWEQLLGDLRA
ncbi:glycosyltransferase [Thermopolyspora sp. NPDC052614]|uniref:glycosyltransferase n=1 Tax=Thermopolyspora sp. NPDC052614 TaxID=3155682 RepID=UPI0034432F26